MKWPSHTHDEYETLKKVLEGKSISRYGDGEFNLIFGGNCKTQKFNPEIRDRLIQILQHPKKVLVGIPRLIGPKIEFWSNYNRPELIKLLPFETYSSFITRPDSAPWIDQPFYWNRIESLWRNKNVTLVRGSAKSLTAELLSIAKTVNEIIIPHKEAFSQYDSILSKIKKSANGPILLCAGPTATVLAYDLANEDYHAIDIGHIGMFLRKHYNNEPMVVTEKDKAFDRK